MLSQNKLKCATETILCITENNYMYCSTLNLFSIVHDKKKNSTLKKELQYTSYVQKNI